ncbi:bifunctional RNase H/acid phosphatase [Streptomyces sp. NPDC006662]|uniref:bifunctional RNase H/acid phosphatase n=2 Tax=unclassified Streptomyces TaxID=2593676 RepID=UPI00340DA37F
MRRFVVEADGGSRGNPGPAGYGAVVLDPVTGETLAERAEFIGVATNNVAEYRGLIAGLKAARELDPDAEVRVRMDSKLVVEQMSGRWKIKHPGMRPLAAEAATILPRGQVTYEWIPRERNKHADRLANEAMDAGRTGTPWQPRSAPTPPAPPSGPPGDAAKGAAAARAALASGRLTGAAAPAPAGAGTVAGTAGDTTDVRAARSAGGAGRTPGAPAADLRAARSAASAPEAGPRTTAEPGRTPGTPAADLRAARSAAAAPEAGPRAAAERDGTPGTPAADLRAARSAATAPEAGTLFDEAEALAPGGSAPATAAGLLVPAGTRAAEAGAAAAPAVGGQAQEAPAGTGWGGPDMGAPATFVLLRHGETALTPQKRFSGSGGSDPELSPAGRRQALAVAEALAARGTVQAVVTSPLRRCRETAQAVADRLGLPVTVEEGLRETDFGAWEGLTFAEVRERFPDDLQAWLDSSKAAPTGGGESFAAVTRRVSATRDRLLTAYAGRTVLLVTHVTPVKTLVRLALGAPPESLFKMELSAASLSAVAYYADGNASLRLLNDTSHLR